MNRLFNSRRGRIILILSIGVLALIVIGIILFLPRPLPDLAGRFVYVEENDTHILKLLTVSSGSRQTIQQVDGAIRQVRWSPDGKQVVILKSRPTAENGAFSADLYLINADGSGLKQITQGVLPAAPVWSPDGHYVAFEGLASPGGSAIFIVDIRSNQMKQLTQYETRDLDPHWSPDSSRIVFTTSRDGFQSIYSMTPAGEALQPLTQTDNLNALQPDWSPDGKRIAYITQYSVGDNSAELHVMNADGSNQRQLTHDLEGEFEPSWSPDSQTIAYMGGTNTQVDIFILNVDSGMAQQLTHALKAVSFTYPHWLADGDHLFFYQSDANGVTASIMNRDGTNVRAILTSRMSGTPAIDWIDS